MVLKSTQIHIYNGGLLSPLFYAGNRRLTLLWKNIVAAEYKRDYAKVLPQMAVLRHCTVTQTTRAFINAAGEAYGQKTTCYCPYQLGQYHLYIIAHLFSQLPPYP